MSSIIQFAHVIKKDILGVFTNYGFSIILIPKVSIVFSKSFLYEIYVLHNIVIMESKMSNLVYPLLHNNPFMIKFVSSISTVYPVAFS